MKKVLSMVLTILMLVSFFSTVLNLGEVTVAAQNQYSTVLPKNNIPSSKPTKSVEPTNTNPGSVKIIGLGLPNYSITPSTFLIPPPTPTCTNTDLQINVESVKGKTDDLVTVPVSFKNVPKDGIPSAYMAFKYDSELLEYVSAEAGNIVPNSKVCFDKSNPSEGNIRLLYTSDFSESSYITTDGVFANVTFKILGSYNKSSQISFADTLIADKDLNAMPVKTAPGCVDISGTEPTPGFQVEVGSTKGYTGDLITIPVSISNIPVNGVYSVHMILDYDVSQLEYVSYKAGSIVPVPSTNFAVNKETDGKLAIIFVNILLEHEYDINSDGVIVNLTFRVVSSGESTVLASKAKFYDGSINEVNATLIPGEIILSEPELITEKICVYSGAFCKEYGYQNEHTILFPIELSNVPSTGIRSVSMTVEYDPTKLKYLDAVRLVMSVPKADTQSTKDVTIQKVSENSFKVLYEASVDEDIINCDGGFAYLYFDVLTPFMNDISIQIKDVAFTDKYGNSVGAEMLSSPVTELSIGSVEASEGSTVVVPVKLDSIPQSGIKICEMHLKYDSEVLEYVSFEAGSLISDTTVCNINENRYNKKLTLVFDSQLNPITTKVDLAYLKFKVKAGSSGFSPIEFEEIPIALASSNLMSRVFVTNGGVKISDEEPKGYTVSGCVYSDIGNTSLSNFSFNEGFKVELAGTAFSAVTDSNGYFEIKNVPVGEYTLGITKANYLARYIKNISVDKDKVLSTASNPITLWCGDIDENGEHDGAINIEDIMKICKAFNSVSGDGKYKEILDLNKDGAVNLEDVMIVVKNFNKCSSDYQ